MNWAASGTGESVVAPVRDACVLFAKPPRPGAVKTRLAAAIGAERAALLYGAFLEDAVEELRRGPYALYLAWALQRGESPPDEPALDTAVLVQRGGDLGARLHDALATLVARGHQRVAAVGSDQPGLRAASVAAAFEALARSDVVLGPALDGGYYLVGSRAASLDGRLFEDIDWSTERVLGQTLERCRELGRSVVLLDPAADVDTRADLERLERGLADDPDLAPRTAALLASWRDR